MIGLAILGLVVFVGSFFVPKDEHLKGLKAGMAFLGILSAIICIPASAYVSVPAGSRGILLQFGAVKGVLSEGANFINPFGQSVQLIEVRTQKEAAKAQAASHDLQTVTTEVAINYHINPSDVGKLFQNVGPDFVSKIIDPATQETVKAVVAKYTAQELIENRDKVKSEIDSGLTQRLAAYNLVVEPGGVSITNFEFSPEFNKAIEAKQVAEQSAEQQKYVLQQAQVAAQTEIAKAEGEAKAAQVRAQALNAQGGSKVLAQQWIEKWDGHLPQVAGGGNMIFDLKSLLGGK